MILLDYIANKGLRLPREGSRRRTLWARRARGGPARGRREPSSRRATERRDHDDHTPFLRAGIPAVDLIDFSYRYGRRVHDTLDKLSTASLDAVGETVYALLSELRAG